MNTNLLNRSKVDAVAPNHPVLITTRGGSILGGRAIEAIEHYYGNELPADYWMVDRERGWS
ncbi:MAG: hypothetical protein GTO60_07050, partial [Gammaproteobacteria bacterium]|nr:hypothetical protein [Gammaproteobacteria bacterium]